MAEAKKSAIDHATEKVGKIDKWLDLLQHVITVSGALIGAKYYLETGKPPAEKKGGGNKDKDGDEIKGAQALLDEAQAFQAFVEGIIYRPLEKEDVVVFQRILQKARDAGVSSFRISKLARIVGYREDTETFTKYVGTKPIRHREKVKGKWIVHTVDEKVYNTEVRKANILGTKIVLRLIGMGYNDAVFFLETTPFLNSPLDTASRVLKGGWKKTWEFISKPDHRTKAKEWGQSAGRTFDSAILTYLGAKTTREAKAKVQQHEQTLDAWQRLGWRKRETSRGNYPCVTLIGLGASVFALGYLFYFA